MHFNIIQLDTGKIPRDERITNFSLCDDTLLARKSDYVDDPIPYDEDLHKVIKHELSPFATVCRKKRTVTFRDRETVMKNLTKRIDRVFRKFMKESKKGRVNYWSLVNELEGGTGADLIYINGYCHRLYDVLEDYLKGYLPKELHIGGIISAHI